MTDQLERIARKNTKEGGMTMPTDAPKSFRLTLTDGVAEVSLDRPEKKNPLTF